MGTEIACNVAYLVQLGIGIEDITENFLLKSLDAEVDVRFKSHGARELKNLRSERLKLFCNLLILSPPLSLKLPIVYTFTLNSPTPTMH